MQTSTIANLPVVSSFNPQSTKWSPVRKMFFALAATVTAGYILHQSEEIKPLIDKTITLLRLKSNRPIIRSNATEISTYVAKTSDLIYTIARFCRISYARDGMPSFKGACSLAQVNRELDAWLIKVQKETEEKIKKIEARVRELIRRSKDPTIEEALESSRRACKKTQEKFQQFGTVSCEESGAHARYPSPPIKLEECPKTPLKQLIFEKGVTPTSFEQAECILGINLHTNTTKGRPPTLSEGIDLIKEASKKLRILHAPDKNADKELAHTLSAEVNSANAFALGYIENLLWPYTLGNSETA